jgi:hypothetical protein
MNRLHHLDFLAAGLLWLAAVGVWGAGVARLGYYADDAGWLASLPHLDSFGQVWTTMRNYMPGRNLHPFWHYLTYRLVGDPAGGLPLLHLLQSALDGLVVAAFYLLLRSSGLPASAVWLASGWFAFWPIHGETHFWLESLPMNLLSTLLVLVFASTSLAFARGRRVWWLWPLEALAFVGALFTYDQVFLVLLLLLGLRVVAAPPRWIALPYLAAAGFCAWLRLSRGGGPLPPGRQALLERIFGNARHTFRSNFGEAAKNHVAPLLANATVGDWILAAALAAGFGLFAWRLLRQPQPAFRAWPPFVLAAAFWAAAYAPVWLWYISPRHQYLPSVGLFAALAVLLGRVRHPAALLPLAAGVALGVAANRGESRFWEAAFTAKRRLFEELRSDVASKRVLVLDSFPFYLGTAFLISSHDANHGPALLLRGTPTAPGFQGFLGSAPAPSGLFFATHANDGPENFRYSDGSGVLVVRFDSWQNGRLHYQKSPATPLPYEFLSNTCEPWDGPIQGAVAARRDDDDLLLSLRFQDGPSPHSWLVALVQFWHWDRFETWGDGYRPGNTCPLLLSEPRAAPQQCRQVLRLRGFPKADRLRVNFFHAFPTGPPASLGRFETRIKP